MISLTNIKVILVKSLWGQKVERGLMFPDTPLIFLQFRALPAKVK
jgi:hypothetical protein